MLGNRFLQSLVISLGALLVAACGGGSASFLGSGSSSGGSSGSGSSGGGSTAASITLVASSTSLPSAAATASTGVTITATVKDASNNILPNTPISFSADAGSVDQSSCGSPCQTDSSGIATAILSTGGDPSNKTITVTASAAGSTGTITKTVQVLESGTKVSVNGPAQISLNTAQSYTATVSDSAGKGVPNTAVAFQSSIGTITPSASPAITDSNGSVTFSYTAASGGTDSLVASAAGATGAISVVISSTGLVFNAPVTTSVQFGQSVSLTVKYTPPAGHSPAGENITFSTSRGSVNGSTSPVTVATTDNGNGTGGATVTYSVVSADGAGGAVVTAQDSGSGVSATQSLLVLATTPSRITVQASPSTILPSAASQITAIVYDASGNVVGNKVVNFRIVNDPTGGALSANTGTTDPSTGAATVNYTAGPNNSNNAQSVDITATVQGIAPQSDALISVTGAGLRVSLGTGGPGTIASYNSNTEYQYQYSVIVQNSAGLPAPQGTVVNLSLVPVAYQKGYFVFNTTDSLWEPVYSVETKRAADAYNAAHHGVPITAVRDNDDDYVPGPPESGSDFGCLNEDQNNSGNIAGQDYNNNGNLDPGFIGNVPASVTLNANGSQSFDVTYLKDRAVWVEVKLIATVVSAANTAQAQAVFQLPGLADDYNKQGISPPGAVSPYGTYSSFSLDGGATSCASPF